MKVAFTDMYPGYENEMVTSPLFNYFQNWSIVKPEEDPDLLVASVFGQNHLNYPETKKLLWSGENLSLGYTWRKRCSFEGIDWAILSNYPEEISLPSDIPAYHVPYAGIHYNLDELKIWRQVNLTKPKSKFCCFVTSRTGQAIGYAMRDKFFDWVNKNYQLVESAGNNRNNVGYLAPRQNKKYIDWVSQYKFMICFENSPGPGYLTEKILTPYAAGTIPIYWGDLSNFSFLQKDAMVFYTSLQETLNKVRLLNENESLYQEVRRAELLNPQKELLLNHRYLQSILDNISQEIKS